MNIAVINSGGDAPGMNAVTASLVAHCAEYNANLYFVRGGYQGLIRGDVFHASVLDTVGIDMRGGSVIGAGRSRDFMSETPFNTAISNLRDHDIDTLIIVGGNGSMKGAIDLEAAGVRTISIPGSIDNDLAFDYSLGYDSAVNANAICVDNIMNSCRAMSIPAIIEVMGRHCPDIANAVGKACFADIIVNEESSIDDIREKVLSIIPHNPSVCVIVKEHTLDASALSESLDTKNTFARIGYVQRGANASAYDRAYGHSMGIYALSLASQGVHNVAIGVLSSELCHIPLTEAIIPHTSTPKIYK